MDFLVKPWAHQLKAMALAYPHDEFALFMEMGTGKSSTMINILRQKINAEGRFLRTLVLAPIITVENWKREFLKFSKIPESKVIALGGTGRRRAKVFQEKAWAGPGELSSGEPHGRVFITNYEALLMSDLFALIKKWKPEVLILDESHRCKTHNSKRTLKTTELARVARYRYLLSGTPVLNSPLDLFSQYLIMDKGQTFGANFFAFRARYFVDRNAGMPKHKYFPNWQLRAGAIAEINEKLKEKSFRVKKEECLDLPPLVKQKVFIELSPEQQEHYNRMKRDFITYVEDKACVATLAITKALRLQQIISGHLPLVSQSGDGNETTIQRFENTPRERALKELLEELTPNHKVLIWATFRENYESIRRVCRDLNVTFVEVHGDIPQSQKFSNVDAFNGDPSVRVLIGHPGSGGIGINLCAASYSIWFSRNFSLEQNLQAEARNYRGGSEIHDKITRIDLVTPRTLDEIILEKLESKLEMSESVLREIANELKKDID